ncbi:MAG: peptidylprolyl isomerase [Saprospiraceae bacterium]|nr:peptidylprolyl isomerase [Saprospiraceae bacterium]MBK8448807.1 peptidylprolyl isomerase [Saprospiraceae bacterium]MBK9722921.1 peptidylprolyl isomerase [Saprospiraceae bacterium]MBK9726785.1 peptidylprolyl isomerase [Saprospiraceae bacterium]
MNHYILLCCLLSQSILFSQNKTIDKIIAKVGGEVILYSDWQEQVSFLKNKQNAFSEDNSCSILENILIQKFMVNRAKVDSIEIKDEEVEQQLNARIEQILAYFNNDYKKFEEYYGQTVSETRDRFKEDLKNQLLTERLQNKVIGEIRITPEETDAFFIRIPKDSVPYFNAEVELSEIVYKPRINETQKKLAKEKLEKIILRLKNGEDFSKIATIQSDDPGSAKNGGALGWMKRGSLVPEFEAVAYGLEKDSISGIVETEFGLHIIQLLERRGNSILSRHILAKPRIEDSDFKLAEKYLDSIRNKILKDTVSFEIAVRYYSDKKSESYNNGGQLINPKTGNASFETGDLDPDVFFAIDGIKVGEITKAFSTTEADGSKTYRIVKLLSKSAPHKANMKQDYAKIQLAAKEYKKNIKFQEWLGNNVPRAYIELDPSIKAICPGVGNWMN